MLYFAKHEIWKRVVEADISVIALLSYLLHTEYITHRFSLQ
jgi:hypothetical protein